MKEDKQPNGTVCSWMPFLQYNAPQGKNAEEIALSELTSGLRKLNIRHEARVSVKGIGETYELLQDGSSLTVKGGTPGVLYGAYRLLGHLARGESIPAGISKPFYPLRMLNHWDNMDGSVERGYAGKSLFFKDNRVCYDNPRIHNYARMLASVGINAVCPNNVNVRPPMDRLITGRALEETAALAGILRLYGIRLILAVDFSLPAAMGARTADPLDKSVIRFWDKRAEEVYEAIPDLAGFLVKADSEHRPGPNTYGRNHAEGANMLARALKPHGGNRKASLTPSLNRERFQRE